MLYDLVLMQKDLMNGIIRKHNLQNEDLHEKTRVALLVELGELANEIRFFKYWSLDQEPQTYTKCTGCKGKGNMGNSGLTCPVCHGTGKDETQNPVLEEYVDGIHFLMQAYLMEFNDESKIKEMLTDVEPLHYNNLTIQFGQLFYEIGGGLYGNLDFILRLYLGIGELLEFTITDIEKAYKAKNKVNYERQENNY